MIHVLRALGQRNKLKLRIASKEINISPDAGELDRLLGAIVHQAMDDGMLKIRFGVDRESGEPFMKYFGPLGYDPEKQIWWDMVPPPSECYPAMLQVCLSLAELVQGFPIKGIIPAIRHWRRINLHLVVEEIDSFEITWDEEYASDRSGELTVIDLPGSEGEESDRDGSNGKDADRDAIR